MGVQRGRHDLYVRSVNGRKENGVRHRWTLFDGGPLCWKDVFFNTSTLNRSPTFNRRTKEASQFCLEDMITRLSNKKNEHVPSEDVGNNGNIGSDFTLRDANGKRVSRLSLYRSRGLLLQGSNEERRKLNYKSKLLRSIQEHTPTLTECGSRSDNTNEEAQMKVENLILEVFPETDWADYIRAMEEGRDDINFTPMTLEMYKTIFWILTYPKGLPVKRPSEIDPTVEVQVVDRDGKRVLGRGNQYKTMTKVVSCVKRMHFEAKLPSPSDLTEGKILLSNMERDYLPGGAPTVDPAILLPAMYEAIHFKSRGKVLNTTLRITRDWAMYLLSWVMFARPSEIFNFCPCIQSLSIPTGIKLCRDGLPPYLLKDLLQWKNRSISKGKYQMRIVRNYLNAKFCPLFWTLYC